MVLWRLKQSPRRDEHAVGMCCCSPWQRLAPWHPPWEEYSIFQVWCCMRHFQWFCQHSCSWRQFQCATQENCKKITIHHQPFSIPLSFLNTWGYTGTEMTLPALPKAFQILVSVYFISGTHLGKDGFGIIVCTVPITGPRSNLLLQHNSLLLFPEHLLLAAFRDRALHWSGIAIPSSAQKRPLSSVRVNGKWDSHHLPRIWDQHPNELRKSKKV